MTNNQIDYNRRFTCRIHLASFISSVSAWLFQVPLNAKCLCVCEYHKRVMFRLRPQKKPENILRLIFVWYNEHWNKSRWISISLYGRIVCHLIDCLFSATLFCSRWARTHSHTHTLAHFCMIVSAALTWVSFLSASHLSQSSMHTNWILIVQVPASQEYRWQTTQIMSIFELHCITSHFSTHRLINSMIEQREWDWDC